MRTDPIARVMHKIRQAPEPEASVASEGIYVSKQWLAHIDRVNSTSNSISTTFTSVRVAPRSTSCSAP